MSWFGRLVWQRFYTLLFDQPQPKNFLKSTSGIPSEGFSDVFFVLGSSDCFCIFSFPAFCFDFLFVLAIFVVQSKMKFNEFNR